MVRAAQPWLALLRSGDWGTVLVGAVLVALSYPLLWQGGTAEKAVVRRDGALVAELPLTIHKRIEVSGPIGVTTIEIEPGRARVLSDPGPRQYCVRQGWLSRPNAIAICAPNHISLSLKGPASASHATDSISY
ncbi:hypothetical protein DLREEDagrD3_15090 [Denitratisoma sp. agr-D3]